MLKNDPISIANSILIYNTYFNDINKIYLM